MLTKEMLLLDRSVNLSHSPIWWKYEGTEVYMWLLRACVCVCSLREILTAPWSETFTGSTFAKTLISSPTERERGGRKLNGAREKEKKDRGEQEREMLIEENGRD